MLIARQAHGFDLDWLWVSFGRFAGTPSITDEGLVKAWVASVLECSFSLSNTEDWSTERRNGVCEWIWNPVTDYTIQGE